MAVKEYGDFSFIDGLFVLKSHKIRYPSSPLLPNSVLFVGHRQTLSTDP